MSPLEQLTHFSFQNNLRFSSVIFVDEKLNNEKIRVLAFSPKDWRILNAFLGKLNETLPENRQLITDACYSAGHWQSEHAYYRVLIPI